MFSVLILERKVMPESYKLSFQSKRLEEKTKE